MKSLFQKNNSNRHKLVVFDDQESLPFNQSITTLEELKGHLQIAIQIEHATIPPYLCALYSIKEGTNKVASDVLQGVAIEEMLHMILVANVINSIGGNPRILAEELMRGYPIFLPYSNDAFEINLQKFSKEAIRTFLKIEKPAPYSAPPQSRRYSSIGQFYKALRYGLEYCHYNTPGGIFNGNPQKQILTTQYYGSGGKLFPVSCLEEAFLAFDEIVGQGEGIDGTISDPDYKLFGEEIEYAHYFRFNELLQERYYRDSDSPQEFPSGEKIELDWASVHNMIDNPKMKNYKKGSEIWQKALKFNEIYVALIGQIHEACNGRPDLFGNSLALMYQLKYLALELLKIPIDKHGVKAGPTFEYIGI